jgi:hypothetical protein
MTWLGVLGKRRLKVESLQFRLLFSLKLSLSCKVLDELAIKALKESATNVGSDG